MAREARIGGIRGPVTTVAGAKPGWMPGVRCRAWLRDGPVRTLRPLERLRAIPRREAGRAAAADRESSWSTREKITFLPIPLMSGPNKYAQKPIRYVQYTAATNPAAAPFYFGTYRQ